MHSGGELLFECLVDHSGHIQEASPGLAECSGHASLTGRPAADLLAVGPLPLPGPASVRALAGAHGQPWPAALRVSEDPLGWRWHLRPLEASSAEGTPALLAELLEHLPLEVSVQDPEGRYLYVNPAALPNPAARQAIVGLTDRGYAAWAGWPATAVQQREAHFRAAAQGEPRRWQEQARRAAGRWRVMQYSLQPVLDPDGALRQVIGFGQDVTAGATEHEELQALLSAVQGFNLGTALLLVGPASGEARVSYVNPALEHLVGRPLPPADADGAPRLTDWLAGTPLAELADWVRGQLRAGGAVAAEVVLNPGSAHQQALTLSCERVQSGAGGQQRWALRVQDASAATRRSGLERGRALVLQLASSGAALPEVLHELVNVIEEVLPGTLGSVLLLEGAQLHVAAAPNVPEPVRSACEGLVIGPSVGSCGTAAYLGRTVVSADVQQDPLWVQFRDIMRACGLGACWSTPIHQDGHVLGTFAVYARGPRQPQPEELGALHQLAALAALLITGDQGRRELSRLAFTDALTGLPNRSALNQRLREALAAAQGREPVGVCLIDIDRFKQINDAFGHEFGDELLLLASQRLRACLTGGETLARMGGDEFALVREGDCGGAQLEATSLRLAGAFKEPFHLRGHAVNVRFSLGWSRSPDLAREPGELLRQADMAMYEAKGSRRAHTVYAPDGDASRTAVALENALYAALGNGEFALHFQPLVRCDTGRVLGFEALLRWQHPVGRSVPIPRLIELAEASGLIHEIGHWVLREACAQLAAWPDPGLSAWVNVSARQLTGEHFVAQIEACLTRHGLNASRLVLEVTESGLLVDRLAATGVLADLHSMGVRVALDDFGTGHASLLDVRQLPLSILKIPREFLDSERGDHAIVQASLALARALGLDVVAEGVEVAAQLDWLRAHACPKIQGYLVARPMPAGEVAAWLGRWSGLPQEAEQGGR